jgi:hypothetical protein
MDAHTKFDALLGRHCRIALRHDTLLLDGAAGSHPWMSTDGHPVSGRATFAIAEMDSLAG